MKYLCKPAEDPWFLFAAYFIALFPLATVYALDFITEKWKTIFETRREGRINVLVAVLCVPYLFYFIHL